MTMRDDAIEPTCYLAIIRALELAARRRRNTGRNTREAIPGVPNYLTHCHIVIADTGEQLDRALGGAWQYLDLTLDRYGVPGEQRTAIVAEVDRYTRHLITYQLEPEPQHLRVMNLGRHAADA